MGIDIVNTKTPNYTPVRRKGRTKKVGDVPAVEEASKSVTTKEDDASKEGRGFKPAARDKHENDGPLEGMIDERI